MYTITALLAKFYHSLRDFLCDLMEESSNDCLFCAHHDLALRRTEKYTCPRCARVYIREED